MRLHHHTPEEVAAELARHPGFWICEVTTAGGTCLLVIPPTDENKERLVPLFENVGLTGAGLDGSSIRTPAAHR